MPILSRIAIISWLLLLAACATQTPESGPVNEQGLSPITNSNFDELLIRPDANFNQYRKIKIEAVTVSYDDRRRTDTLNRRKEAFQFDERELAMFNQQFVKAVSSQWQKAFGWELTEETGSDVIVVKAEVTDLYLYASIKNNEIYPTKAATNESSRMVIHLSLLDSQSGEVLLDSQGKKITGLRGSGVNTMTRTSSVRYWSDAHQAFRQWATQLASQIEYQNDAS
jgi:hypothetical protein